MIAIIVAAVEETRQEETRQEEIQRQQNAFRQIIVKDVDFEGAVFTGGIDINSITLSNPTKYAFRRVRYQFYDADDNIVKIDDYVGPLMPYETKEFSINLHCEGLWEHKYGVRIVAGEVAE
ncbi:MAG: hypothetical protein ABIL44_01760 [candidate division WOR-3 bacterium]